jgi:hypothetical protein
VYFPQILVVVFGHSIPDYLELKEKDFHGITSPRLTTFVFSLVACH